MLDEQICTVEWDGNALIGWITINGVPTRVTADRDTIHRHAPGFNDALTWEIKSHAAEIFEKMKPFFLTTYHKETAMAASSVLAPPVKTGQPVGP